MECRPSPGKMEQAEVGEVEEEDSLPAPSSIITSNGIISRRPPSASIATAKARRILSARHFRPPVTTVRHQPSAVMSVSTIVCPCFACIYLFSTIVFLTSSPHCFQSPRPHHSLSFAETFTTSVFNAVPVISLPFVFSFLLSFQLSFSSYIPSFATLFPRIP